MSASIWESAGQEASGAVNKPLRSFTVLWHYPLNTVKVEKIITNNHNQSPCVLIEGVLATSIFKISSSTNIVCLLLQSDAHVVCCSAPAWTD